MIHLDPCIIATALMSLIPAVIAASGGATPGQQDFMAALGAGPATVIVLLYCQRKGRGLTETISAFMASGACGIIVPGAALWTWAPNFAATCPWNLWALLGMLCALAGWFLVLAVLKFFERYSPSLVGGIGKKYLPLPDSEPGDSRPPEKPQQP